MSKVKKRPYRSSHREESAARTKESILEAAKSLFIEKGFECVTIEKIAQKAGVSIPTIYALFQSKIGVLKALIDAALPSDQFEALVEKSIHAKSPEERLRFSAKIAREIYDAENTQMALFQNVSILSPEFKKLEKEREVRRYIRQEITIDAMVKEKSLAKGLNKKKARDILWAFTGRDMYRMLVIEQKWSSDAYEKWLTLQLIRNLAC